MSDFEKTQWHPPFCAAVKEVPEMCEALNTLMKPELDAALSKGRAEATTELAAAIKRLNRGDTVEKLIADGFSKDIVNSAKEVIEEL